jgi:hypothetical protein
MSDQIERVLYYEREYLRSFDFIAEQNYHLQMRRRLNLALHLWGIVEGLDVKLGGVVSGAPDQYYISPGMAIDAYGREILLFAPYILTEDDIQANRIINPGRYSLWIAYTRSEATPPAPGYRLCNLPDQYTRWREFYRILILPKDYALPAIEPGATDDLSDDPDKQFWPVRLGSVDVEDIGGELRIKKAWPKARTYIGLRAQRIVAPVATLGPSAPDANRPIEVEADLRADKNLIVGKDFWVDPNQVKPKPTVSPFHSLNGNLKVRRDIFLNGNLYAKSGGEWLGLSELVKTLMPEIQINPSLTITPSLTTTDPSNDTVFVRLISNILKNPSRASLLVSLNKIEMKSKTGLTTWWNGVGVTSAVPVQLSVKAGPPSKIANTNNQFDVGISWSVGPNSSGVSPTINITSLDVSYIAVFYP